MLALDRLISTGDGDLRGLEPATLGLMRVLHWNVCGGDDRVKVEWLKEQSWDVAVLLELSLAGRKRIARVQERAGWTGKTSLDVPGPAGHRRMSVGIFARGDARCTGRASTSPLLSDARYRERALAAEVEVDSRPVVVAGFHAPNARSGDGQAPKETAFSEIVAWVNETAGPLVLGVDTNTWSQGARKGRRDPHPDLFHQETFQMEGESHLLRDAFSGAATANPALCEEEQWWTYDTGTRRCRMDQIWSSSHFRCTGSGVLADTPGVRSGGAHRALFAQLELT